jgi:hypothetical protein
MYIMLRLGVFVVEIHVAGFRRHGFAFPCLAGD